MTITSATFSINAVAIDEGDKLLIEIGSLSTNADTKIRVDGTGGMVGTTIDFEDDLGFERGKQINRLNLRYRFSDKHSLKYSFFQLDRTANRVIDKTFMFGDTEFQVNANITAGFDFSLHSVSYGYALHSSDDSRLDVLAGIFYVDTAVSVSEPNLGIAESLDAAGPLPVVGLNYEKKLSGPWNLGANATVFKLDIGDYNGLVLDARIRIDYQFTDRFALGLAYNWQRLDVGVEGSTATGDFKLDTNGAEISAVLRF